MSVRTIHLFTDVHMGMSHHALAELARRDAKIDPQTLPQGQILMFLNKRKDKLKILGAQGKVVGYLKMPDGERIDMQAVQYIPHAMGAQGEINYPAALRRTLEERLAVAGKHSSLTAGSKSTQKQAH